MTKLPTLDLVISSAWHAVEVGLKKYRTSFKKEEIDVLIELALAPSTTLTHTVVTSKREEQMKAYPQIEQFVLWVARAAMTDLAAKMESSIKDTVIAVNAYSGLTGGEQQAYRIDYGLFMISLLSTDLLKIMSPTKVPKLA